MLTRQRFASDKVDDALAFAQLFPGLAFSTSVLRRLLTSLVRDNDAVFDMWKDGQRALLAVVSDVCENGAGSGGIVLLGRGPGIDLESIAEALVGPALAYAKSGPRQLVDMQLPEALVGQACCLEPLGFNLAYYTYSMQRPRGASPPTEPPLLAGWRWRNIDRGTVPLFHAALKQIFASSAGTNLSPLDEFAANSLAATSAQRTP